MGTGRLIVLKNLFSFLSYLFCFLSGYLFASQANIRGVTDSAVWDQAVSLMQSAAWQCDGDAQIRMEKLLMQLGTSGESLLKSFLDKQSLNAKQYCLALYAATLLGRFGSPDSVPFLRERLVTGYQLVFPAPILKGAPGFSWQQRENFDQSYYQHLLTVTIMASLVRLGETDYLKKIEEEVGHPQVEWAAAAIQALGQTGSLQAVEILHGLISDQRVNENSMLMEACLQALGNTGQFPSALVLMSLIQRKSWPARWKDLCCGSLGKIGLASATPVILSFCRESTACQEAEVALQRLGKAATGYLTEALLSDKSAHTTKWCKILAKIGSPEAMAGFRTLWEKTGCQEKETLAAVTEAMLAVEPEETELFLKQKLLDKDGVTVRKAATSIAATGIRSLKGVLIQVLKGTENAELRKALVKSLIQLAGCDEISFLQTLLSDKQEEIRLASLTALSGSEEGRKFLVEYLSNPSALDWEKGIRILGVAQSREAFPLFVRFLAEGEEKQKIAVSLACGDTGDWQFVKPLLSKVMDDESLEVKKAAVYSVEQIFLANRAFLKERSQSVLPLLLKISSSQQVVLRAKSAILLGLVGRQSGLNRLLEMAEDPEVEVRKSVALALAGYRGEKVFQILDRLLQDTNEEVRRQAAESLR